MCTPYIMCYILQLIWSLSLFFFSQANVYHHTACCTVGSLKGIIDSLSSTVEELTDLAKKRINKFEGPICSEQDVFHFTTPISINATQIKKRTSLPEDCTSIYHQVNQTNGIYKIWPHFLNHPISVYGDIRQRVDGKDIIFALTKQNNMVLRLVLEDMEGGQRYAEYYEFLVQSEMELYKISYKTYRGDAGDSLSTHNNMMFTTRDSATTYKGGLWYNECHKSNLNGLYLGESHEEFAVGINWYHWKGHKYSLKKSEIKIRPVGFVSRKEPQK
ncbi:techylectin-5B-like [Tachypleus tridentatus]|uniref:techylectin-5B-like n=1 Tax=Tachypleus tridentatus TaxID=6853 RepID=UPI003FD3A97B